MMTPTHQIHSGSGPSRCILMTVCSWNLIQNEIVMTWRKVDYDEDDDDDDGDDDGVSQSLSSSVYSIF